MESNYYYVESQIPLLVSTKDNEGPNIKGVLKAASSYVTRSQLLQVAQAEEVITG